MAYYHFGVLGPPLVQVVPDIIETVEGRNITAMCNVTGNPKPDRIIWKRSDGILSSARTMVSKGNLTILNTTTQDNGFYSKPLGYEIIVSYPSCLLKPPPKPPSNVTVIAYEDLILPCFTPLDLKPTIIHMYN